MLALKWVVREMESRYEVEMEHYSKIINIEALTMLYMTPGVCPRSANTASAR